MAAACVKEVPQPHRVAEGETVCPFAGTLGMADRLLRLFDHAPLAWGDAVMASATDDLPPSLEALPQGNRTRLPGERVQDMARDRTDGDAPGFSSGVGFAVLRHPILTAPPESSGTWRGGGDGGHFSFVDRARGRNVVASTHILYPGMSGRFDNELRGAVYGVPGAAR